MSVQVQAATPVTITTADRTWRATIDAPAGGTYTLTINRELALTDPSGGLVAPTSRNGDFVFPLSAIQNASVTVAGTTLTVAQLAAFLQAAFDQLVTAARAASGGPPAST
jgi:hypothetical protein